MAVMALAFSSQSYFLWELVIDYSSATIDGNEKKKKEERGGGLR